MFVSEQEEENWKEALLSKEEKERLIDKFEKTTGYNWYGKTLRIIMIV
ncbi:unnamed protein product [Brassica oleracea]